MRIIPRSGVDLVDVARIADLIESGGVGFLGDVWTPTEQTYCAGNPECLAGRWAAKEATMKALGAGFPELRFVDIEVVGEAGGAPVLRLHGTAAKKANTLGITDWSVSISHERALAVAVVFATGSITP
jgi:holo-[acyl-carrier protein] synthase